MAEIIIKIGDSTNPKGYKDGDIICAFSENRIGRCHADMICDIKKTELNKDGLRLDGLAKKYQELISQYKFERISHTEIRRTELGTVNVDIISNIPNAKGEYMDVPLFIENRKKHSRHKIFGTTGSEVWYRGKKTYKHTAVWDMIEVNSSNQRDNFTKWVLTEQEKKSYLALSVDNFNDEEAGVLVESEFDTDGETILKKRKNKVDWQSLSLSKTKEQIQDKTVLTDLRGTQLLRKNIVIEK